LDLTLCGYFKEIAGIIGVPARIISALGLNLLVQNSMRSLLELGNVSLENNVELVSEIIFLHKNGPVRMDLVVHVKFGNLDEIVEICRCFELGSEPFVAAEKCDYGIVVGGIFIVLRILNGLEDFGKEGIELRIRRM